MSGMVENADRLPRQARWFSRLLLACGLFLSWASVPENAQAEEIFRYRDSRGVLHFSNVPTDRRFERVMPGEPLVEDAPALVEPERIAPPEVLSVAPATIARMIDETAFRYRIEKATLHAMVRAESGFNPLAVSSAGACGLLQLMPTTARSLGVEDIFHPRQNLEGGALYFRRLLQRFDGNGRLALAAFNAGPRTVEDYGGVPPFPETERYLEAVSRFRVEYLRERESKPHMIQRRATPAS